MELKVPPSSSDLGKGQRRERGPLESDWAEASTEVIVRHCPICVQDSIVGHGRRRKQAHDEHHDWIGIRRGLCNRCGKTFTFLPPFSPPYGHYSFIARSQALQRYFLEGRCWEDGWLPPTLCVFRRCE